MRARRYDRLSNFELLRILAAALAQERISLATVLACVAELDARRLWASAGYPSLHQYCVQKLGFSDEAAFKRIHAARAARRFPEILVGVAEGRLHLSAVVTLAPYLTESTAAELLAAASGKTRREIELLLAQRFPKPDVPEQVTPLATPVPASAPPADLLTSTPEVQHAPGRVGTQVDQVSQALTSPEHAAGRVETPGPYPKVAPLSPERFALQVTITQSTHDKLRRAQDLMSKTSSNDLASVLDQALDALIERLEKRKFAATSKPGRARPSENPRTIPARVKRAVKERDGGQCTFVGEDGHRCGSRRALEFDHAQPVSCGGRATVDNIRLRCHVHNQYEADRIFGAGFMSEKRNDRRATQPGAAASP